MSLMKYDMILGTIQRSEEFESMGTIQRSEEFESINGDERLKSIQMSWFKNYKASKSAAALLVLLVGSSILGLVSSASVSWF